MIDIRVFYHKTGRARYISHLDMMRCMQRAIVRAKLPVWYTEGFNPHIYLTFALPLSLGYESKSEVMDLRLIDDAFPLSEVTSRLNDALPPDIRIHTTAKIQNKPQAITHAIYTIQLFSNTQSAEVLRDRFCAFMRSTQILVEKRAKQGRRKITKQIDIRPMCELLSCEVSGDVVLLTLKTQAGIQSNLNPSLLLEAFIQTNEGLPLRWHICRDALLMEDVSPFC